MANSKILHHINDQAYILVSYGEISINDNIICAGDGAEITKTWRKAPDFRHGDISH